MKAVAVLVALFMVLAVTGPAMACKPCPPPEPDPITKRSPGSGGGPYGLSDGIPDCSTEKECKTALVIWSFLSGGVGFIPGLVGGLLYVHKDDFRDR